MFNGTIPIAICLAKQRFSDARGGDTGSQSLNRGVFRLIFAPNRARIPFIEDPFNGLVTSNTTLRFVSGLAGNLGRPVKFVG
jgi:hypothetical protein